MEQVGTRDETMLASPAWLMVGATQSLPGVLWHDGHRLVLELEGEHAARGLDVPVAEVRDVAFPWYYFGGGCRLTAGGRAGKAWRQRLTG